MASQPRILVLGFGGTGYEALIELKTLFAQNPGKVPPHCGLLYFDTVAPKDHGAGLNERVSSAFLPRAIASSSARTIVGTITTVATSRVQRYIVGSP